MQVASALYYLLILHTSGVHTIADIDYAFLHQLASLWASGKRGILGKYRFKHDNGKQQEKYEHSLPNEDIQDIFIHFLISHYYKF